MRRSGAIALLLACAAAGAQTVQQPRPFGYTVGDLATQRVLLPAGGNASLPEPGRANAWLERRAARIERDADGRRWLAVDYQVITAPRTLASVPIPAWDLAGTPPLRVPAATISVGPLTTAPVAGQAVPLRVLAPQRGLACIAAVLRG